MKDYEAAHAVAEEKDAEIAKLKDQLKQIQETARWNGQRCDEEATAAGEAQRRAEAAEAEVIQLKAKPLRPAGRREVREDGPMAAYMRRRGILPVCTNNEARAYFAGKGLTYADVTEGDILALVMLLNKHIKKANADCETSMGSMYLSRRIDLKRKTNGTLISCFLYVNSHYFERRECISFNADGLDRLRGWADQGNTNPILRAFIEWCDALAATKEKEDTQQ